LDVEVMNKGRFDFVQSNIFSCLEFV
jgi:hypothetical protein